MHTPGDEQIHWAPWGIEKAPADWLRSRWCLLHAYLGLGDNDEAFAWFEPAYAEQSNILIYIKVFPPYDSLRGDPRFSSWSPRRAEFDPGVSLEIGEPIPFVI